MRKGPISLPWQGFTIREPFRPTNDDRLPAARVGKRRLSIYVDHRRSDLRNGPDARVETSRTASSMAAFKRGPALPGTWLQPFLAVRDPSAPTPGQAGSALIFSRFLASRPQATPGRRTGSSRSMHFSAWRRVRAGRREERSGGGALRPRRRGVSRSSRCPRSRPGSRA